MSANKADQQPSIPPSRSNLRLGLILGSIALVVFFGVILRYWILRG